MTYLALELKRILRDFSSVFFIAVLPAFFYVIFGAAQDYSQESAGNGNVAMYVLISMAAYGAATATTSIGGRAAVERLQGWGRQLGLTPLSDGRYVATKTALALLIGLIPIALTYLIGAFTGAAADWQVWVASAAIVAAGAMLWSLYGLCAGLAFRSESAVGAASGVLVILAFLGNLFVPLSGTLLAIAKWTPLYGYVTLARYPLTEGWEPNGEGVSHVDWQLAAVNVTAWTLIFATTAWLLVRRGRGRQ